MDLPTARSADGTELRTWTNGGTGPAVLLCNGLGVPPTAWPALLEPTCGFQVVSWSHRGLGGSARPADPSRRGVEHHAQDARAVLDAFALPSALALGWSVGVNVAFELAAQSPDRLRGVLAVAGVPGGSYESLFAPMGMPRAFRRPAGRAGAQLLRVYGPMLALVTGSLPGGAHALAGLAGPARELAQVRALTAVLTEFARHDWDWYHDLAVEMGEHGLVDLSGVRVPVTLLAGSHDALVDVEDVRAAAGRLADVRLVEVPGTHYLPLQRPALMLDELRLLSARADAIA